MTDTLVIVDSGANIASLKFALDRLGIAATLSADAKTILGADRVILPGVGAAENGMARLRANDLATLIPKLTQPVLGICLGMQLLADRSEEGNTPCLGILPLTACRLPASTLMPVPNMGWCPVTTDVDHPLFTNIPDGSYFYFVHSYALPLSRWSLASARHAYEFSAVSACHNFYAAQFHPERSAAAGEQFLKNFLELPA